MIGSEELKTTVLGIALEADTTNCLCSEGVNDVYPFMTNNTGVYFYAFGAEMCPNIW